MYVGRCVGGRRVWLEGGVLEGGVYVGRCVGGRHVCREVCWREACM